MATFTQNYDLEKPTPDDPSSEDTWGQTLNNNMDLIDAAITGAALHKAPMYRWSRSQNLTRWESYSITPSNEGGLLRFTNDAGPGDSAIYLSVPSDRIIVVRASVSSATGMDENSPEMHLGHEAELYGGYGFDYPVNEDIPITTINETLCIYMNTREGAAGAFVEFSDITVDLVESGQRITASINPPAAPSPGDIWIDIS